MNETQQNLGIAYGWRAAADTITAVRTAAALAEAASIATDNRLMSWIPEYQTYALAGTHLGIVLGDRGDGLCAGMAERHGLPIRKHNSQFDDITDKIGDHAVAFSSIIALWKKGNRYTALGLAVPQTVILLRDAAITLERFRAPEGVDVRATKESKRKTGLLNALKVVELSPASKSAAVRGALVGARIAASMISVKTYRIAKESYRKQKLALSRP